MIFSRISLYRFIFLLALFALIPFQSHAQNIKTSDATIPSWLIPFSPHPIGDEPFEIPGPGGTCFDHTYGNGQITTMAELQKRCDLYCMFQGERCRLVGRSKNLETDGWCLALCDSGVE